MVLFAENEVAALVWAVVAHLLGAGVVGLLGAGVEPYQQEYVCETWALLVVLLIVLQVFSVAVEHQGVQLDVAKLPAAA